MTVDLNDVETIKSLIVEPITTRIASLEVAIKEIHSPANCPITLNVIPGILKDVQDLRETKANWKGKWSVIGGLFGLISLALVAIKTVWEMVRR